MATLRIDRMAPEGEALGRLAGSEGAGKVVFVPYAVPGDEVEAEVSPAKPGYSRGRILQVRRPGPDRVAPPCPFHFRPGGPPHWCGGCDWQQLSYAGQLTAKREIVKDCLRRIAKLPGVEVEPVIASPQQWRYRNKVQVPFGLARGAGQPKLVAGFYAPGSHRIVDFDDCRVQSELSVRIALKVKELAAEYGWRVYDEARGTGWLKHLFVRVNRKGQALAALITRAPELPRREEFIAAMRASFPQLASLHQNLQPLHSSGDLGKEWRRLWGSPKLEETVGRLRLSCSPAAFLQVNTPACELLYGKVREYVEAGGFRPGLLVDLYSGVGAIALSLSGSARRVLGIEENREAVADAWANARANGAKNVRFSAGRAETTLGRLRAELSRCAPGSAAVVLDPPRAGCEAAVLKALQAPQVRRIVYVSCNPATFSRDAARLAGSGYVLRRVQPVDLFPQTSHVETVGQFDRPDRPLGPSGHGPLGTGNLEPPGS